MLRSGKRDSSRHEYVLMAMTGKTGIHRDEFYALLVYPNDCDGGENRYFPGKEIFHVADMARWPWRGGKTGIVREKRSSTSQIWPDDRDE